MRNFPTKNFSLIFVKNGNLRLRVPPEARSILLEIVENLHSKCQGPFKFESSPLPCPPIPHVLRVVLFQLEASVKRPFTDSVAHANKLCF